MADPITWPVAFTILGGISVAAVTLTGFLIQNFRKENPWKEPVSKLSTTVIKLEGALDLLTDKLDSQEKSIEDHGARNEKDFDLIHKRLEKVTDLMIKMLTDDVLSHTIKSEKE